MTKTGIELEKKKGKKLVDLLISKKITVDNAAGKKRAVFREKNGNLLFGKFDQFLSVKHSIYKFLIAFDLNFFKASCFLKSGFLF